MIPNTPHTWINLGHSTLPYQRIGSGPDVVFIHGWPLHGGTWRPLVERLSADYTCHVVDLPGTGASIYGAASPISLQGHAATVREVLDHLNLDRYAMVAHDSGGLFARMAIASDPRCAALILGNTEIPGYVPPMLKFMALAGRFGFFKAGLRLAMSSRWGRRSRFGFGGCFHNKDLIEGEFHAQFTAPLLASKAAFAGQMRLLDTFDFKVMANLRTVHSQISCPVRLVWGADDPWFPLSRARHMLDQFGGPADLVVLENAKLFCHEEYPDAFARATRETLGRAFVAPTAAVPHSAAMSH